jgi:prepilin-type N-terminal cleavage/methylation domain-containing protein
MSQNTKGFTLVELLVAIAIMSTIAVASTRLVFDAVSYRAKQYGVDESSEAVRSILSTLRQDVQSATGFPAVGSTLTVTGYKSDGTQYCTTTKLNGNYLESGKASTCGAIVFTRLHSDLVTITAFNAQKDSSHLNMLNITISGKYKDKLGEHLFTNHTALTSKAML